MVISSLYRNREKDLGSQNGFIEKKSTRSWLLFFLVFDKKRTPYKYGVPRE